MIFIERLAQSLNKNNVEYAIVGGFAVALHGAVRGTVDVDLVLKISLQNFKKAELAFHDIGLKSRLPIGASEAFHFREEYIKNKNLIGWTFVNPSNPVEIVDVIITDNLTNMKTITKKLGRVLVPVLSIDDLIKMKRRSGRSMT